MKKCPFCAEEIQDEAVKCRYCHEFLDEKQRNTTQKKWYFKTNILILALLSIGPFALPLIWFNPRFRQTTKIIISIIICVLSYLLITMALDAIQVIIAAYSEALNLI